MHQALTKMHHVFSEMHHEKWKMHHALLSDAPRISHSIKIGVLSHNELVSDFEQNYQNRRSVLSFSLIFLAFLKAADLVWNKKNFDYGLRNNKTGLLISTGHYHFCFMHIIFTTPLSTPRTVRASCSTGIKKKPIPYYRWPGTNCPKACLGMAS